MESVIQSQDCEAGSSGQLWFTFCLRSLQWVGIVIIVFCHSASVLREFNFIPRRGGIMLVPSHLLLPATT